MHNNQTAEIIWRNGIVPVSKRFDDPYFSLENGLAEARHVFLAGNGLPERLQAGFHVAELGFGAGLNMLALAQVWGGQKPVKFTSFEAFPMAHKDIAAALAAFPELHDLAEPFLKAWGMEQQRFQVAGLDVEIIIGDAPASLNAWQGQADAWFLDGFSPAKNPDLWTPDLMAEVAAHTATDGTFATYTAAGHVRRSLAAAGFLVERCQGFGRKRHMSAGRLRKTTE